ncbi:MAG TPA: amidohydrolase family protein, partial [Candidatus Polarisedimenticolia bacterium]|nr:amidohydrolase family protein [Candidatus Polarisedimenticolia bacterium]
MKLSPSRLMIRPVPRPAWISIQALLVATGLVTAGSLAGGTLGGAASAATASSTPQATRAAPGTGVVAEAAKGKTRGILCGQLIDGRSERPLKKAAILIEEDRIVKVGGPEILPKGIEVIDLGSATVLPGLIDMHSHPLESTDSYQIDHLRWSSAYKALRGLKAVQDDLMSGWTTLRIPGDGDVFYANFDLRRAINEGLFVGPRITGAGHYISATGGGGDINFMSPEQHLIADGLVVDGPEEMRKAVREEIKYGSDWIKLLVTGAFMSVGDNPNNVHFSPEELKVAVEEAARRDVPVMAHAHAAEGIKMAIRAGVRSIEHGTFMDAEAIRLMVERGVYLVPTIYVGEYYVEGGSESPEMQKNVELSRKYHAEFLRRVGEAIKAGVRICVGSDFGAYPPEINAREFASLVKAGMTPMQAIQAGTRVASEALRWDDRIGTLEAGKLADLVAV